MIVDSFVFDADFVTKVRACGHDPRNGWIVTESGLIHESDMKEDECNAGND